MLPWVIVAVGILTIGAHGQVKHNLPPGVELVDPKSLGFDESQLDLSSLLGNVKLLPINSNTDPKTGLKTQVLTVGFDGKDGEDFNLDDFELPGQQGGNNSELVQNAFQSFKEYFKKGNQGQQQQQQLQLPIATVATPTATPVAITAPRRRKVIKKPQLPPKVVELESDQIEKLLATGKLKSRKIGDSQVIEITQDQLNELYAMENGGEFRELLGRQPELVQQEEPRQQVQQQPRQQVVQQPQQPRQQAVSATTATGTS